MNKILIFIFSLMTVAFVSSCEKDNYDAPTSTLSGTIVYDNTPVQVRNGRIELELWQEGFSRPTKIPVFTNQEGAFSATVFDGNYKLVLVRGLGPWLPNSDTVSVSVSGAATATVPVTPYFVINNPQFTRNDSAIAATLSIQDVADSNDVEYVSIYLSKNQILDINNNMANAVKGAGAFDSTATQNISVNIPDALKNEESVYARLGLKTHGVEELIYSAPVKL